MELNNKRPRMSDISSEQVMNNIQDFAEVIIKRKDAMDHMAFRKDIEEYAAMVRKLNSSLKRPSKEDYMEALEKTRGIRGKYITPKVVGEHDLNENEDLKPYFKMNVMLNVMTKRLGEKISK